MPMQNGTQTSDSTKPQSQSKSRENQNPQYSPEEEAKLREVIKNARHPIAVEMAEEALMRMGCKP